MRSDAKATVLIHSKLESQRLVHRRRVTMLLERLRESRRTQKPTSLQLVAAQGLVNELAKEQELERLIEWNEQSKTET